MVWHDQGLADLDLHRLIVDRRDAQNFGLHLCLGRIDFVRMVVVRPIPQFAVRCFGQLIRTTQYRFQALVVVLDIIGFPVAHIICDFTEGHRLRRFQFFDFFSQQDRQFRVRINGEWHRADFLQGKEHRPANHRGHAHCHADHAEYLPFEGIAACAQKEFFFVICHV